MLFLGVIDDEKPAVDGMVFLLQKLVPAAKVKGFVDPEAFVKWCIASEPQLVVMDIEMPTISGIELAKKVDPYVGSIVFSTAYAEYSLDAFETKAIDYILKPVEESRLVKALEKVDELGGKGLLEKAHIRVPGKGGMVYLPLNQVKVIRGQRNYSEVETDKGEKFLIAKTLKNFEDELAGTFVRIHKSNLVHRSWIDTVKKVAGKASVELKDGTCLEASLKRLEENGLV